MTIYVYTAPDRFPLAPPLPQKYAQNGAEAEVCRGRRTFNTGSRYEPVLKGGAEACGSPTCATL